MSELKTRSVEGGTASVTKGHVFRLALHGEGGETFLRGKVNIEYAPRQHTLEESSLIDLRDNVVGEADTAEEIVVAVYTALVESIFPGYTGRSEPWEVTPMVVDLNYTTVQPFDEFNSYTSLGSFR